MEQRWNIDDHKLLVALDFVQNDQRERLLAKTPVRRKSALGACPVTGAYQRNQVETSLDLAMARTPTGSNLLTRRLTGNRIKFNESLDFVASPSVTIEEEAAKVNEEEKTTLHETTVNASLTLIGCGVLGIPYAFGQAGLLSSVMLLAITGITCWTAVLIGRLMDAAKPLAMVQGVSEDEIDWPFLGFAAYGDMGRAFCSIVFICNLWFCLVALLVVNGINLSLIFPGSVSVLGGIVISGVASFLFLFPSAKVLSYFSVFGILSTVLGLGSLLWSAEVMAKWEAEVAPLELVNWENTPMALGIFQFCFVAHSVFPSMHRCMRNPSSEFSTAMLRSFTFAGCFYLFVGLIAFGVYGSQAQTSFMSNLGRELDLTQIPHMSFLCIICTSCFAINLQATFPVAAIGLISASENGLNIAGSSWLVRTTWKVIFMAATTFVAVVLRKCMSPVQSLVGCLCGTNTCLLLPMLCSMKLLPMGTGTKVLMFAVLIYGVYILIYGTFTNILVIVDLVSN